jgi:integrase
MISRGSHVVAKIATARLGLWRGIIMNKITKRTVDAAKPGPVRYVLWDSDVKGFGFRVAPINKKTKRAKKTYVLKCRLKSGEQRWIEIGPHGSPWTSETARERAKELLHNIAAGRDPVNEKQAAKAMPTMTELCDLYLAEGVAHKKPLTIKSDRGRIERHIKPLLGKKKVDRVTRADCERLLNDVQTGKTAMKVTGKRPLGALTKGGHGAAAQSVTLLSTIMGFAIERGYHADNPAKGIKKTPVRKMERFLSEAEIARLGEALEYESEASSDPYPGTALKLLILTGCRRWEILSLQWTHVDFEHGLLRLPDSKTGQKVVYLNAPALMLLSGLPRVAGNRFVIVGKEEGKHFNGIGKIWDRVRTRAGLENVRLHDLRHSFASVGVGGNLSLPIIGALLGHKNAATTQRYAHLAADPLRAANEVVGAKIAAAMAGTKGEIMPLRR